MIREEVHLGLLARALIQSILELLCLIVLIALITLVFFIARFFLAELRVNDLKLILMVKLEDAALGPKALEFSWAAPTLGWGEDGQTGCPSIDKPEKALIDIFLSNTETAEDSVFCQEESISALLPLQVVDFYQFVIFAPTEICKLDRVDLILKLVFLCLT
jgi:hypothetical protein